MDQTIYYNCQFHIIRKPSEYQENITIYLKNKLRHWEVRFLNSERPGDAIRCPGLQQAAGPLAAVLSALRGQLGVVTNCRGPYRPHLSPPQQRLELLPRSEGPFPFKLCPPPTDRVFKLDRI